MVERIKRLENATLRGAQYLFIFLEQQDSSSALSNAIEPNALRFGDDLCEAGRVELINPRFLIQARATVGQKEWPSFAAEEVRNERGPYLLVIDQDFHRFHPTTDRWSIVWLSDMLNPRGRLPRLLEELSRVATGSEEELFGFLDRQRNQKSKSYYGRISLNGDRWASRDPRPKGGRPPLLDPKSGVFDAVVRAAVDLGISKIKVGDKGRMCELAERNLARDRRYSCKARSIRDAITGEGRWDEVEELIKKQQHR